MRTLLARMFYLLGHVISIPMAKFDWAWLYPIYNQLMITSSNLDIHNKVWRKPDEHEDYSNRSI